MVAVPPPRDATLDAIDEKIVAANDVTPRGYYGASQAGDDCERRQWYRLHWALPEYHSAATLRRFADGFAGEDLMASRLRLVEDIDLRTHRNGEQFEVSAIAGHLKGHLDGCIKGVHAAPKTWHVWEHKQVQQTGSHGFNRLKKLITEDEKEALEQWNSNYFAQAQLYMGLANLKRHYLTVSTPGGRDYISCRTDYQPKAFKAIIEKAERVISDRELPVRISADPEYFQCGWCGFKETCHGDKTAQVNCRTCLHGRPITDEKAGAPGKPAGRGTWYCEFHSKNLSLKLQRTGCSDHLFHPGLIPWATLMGTDEENNLNLYATKKKKTFINGHKNDWAGDPPTFTSKDLQHVDDKFIESEEKVLTAMASFQTAHIVSVEKAKEKPPEDFNDPIPF